MESLKDKKIFGHDLSKKAKHKSIEEIAIRFAKELAFKQKDIDPEISKAINDKLWDFL